MPTRSVHSLLASLEHTHTLSPVRRSVTPSSLFFSSHVLCSVMAETHPRRREDGREQDVDAVQQPGRGGLRPVGAVGFALHPHGGPRGVHLRQQGKTSLTLLYWFCAAGVVPLGYIYDSRVCVVGVLSMNSRSCFRQGDNTAGTRQLRCDCICLTLCLQVYTHNLRYLTLLFIQLRNKCAFTLLVLLCDQPGSAPGTGLS